MTITVPSLAIIRGAQRPAPLKVRPALFISALPICWLIGLVQLPLYTVGKRSLLRILCQPCVHV